MELKTFVTETLCQIMEGVQDAIDRRMAAGGKGAINPHFSPHEESKKAIVEKVVFDVAVTASDSQEKSGTGGLKVWGVGAGVSAKGATGTETVSRIQFVVPVVVPATNIIQDETAATAQGIAEINSKLTTRGRVA